MKKPEAIINLLSRCEGAGADIHEIHEARWLSNFHASHPSYINIICHDDLDPSTPIFKAVLTPRGMAYLKELQREVSGLRETVHQF